MKKCVRGLLMGLVFVTAMGAVTSRAEAQGIYVDYYQPQFYIDKLVFYDEAGTPIYYEGDVAYAVPKSYEYYNELYDHFQGHADAYYRWFEEVGYAHLNYRRPIAANYYKPMYYMDYPVFYDDTGYPIYYVNGAVRRVPPSYAAFHALRQHYRMHRANYRRWYGAWGRHYRWYHRPLRTGYYTPLYFDGYVVYYDATGRPYYYMGGRTVYIPHNHPRHRYYVDYYRRHRPGYTRWYRERGNRYRSYRRPKYYRTRVVAPRAPRAVRGRAVHRRYERRAVRHDRRMERHDRRMERRDNRVDRRNNRIERRMERRDHRVERRNNRVERRMERRGVDCRRQPGHPSCRRHDRQMQRQDRRQNRQERRMERRNNRQERRHQRQERRGGGRRHR